MRPKTYLLDTSFLIDLAAEIEAGQEGPAVRMLTRIATDKLFISPVTVAELLEHETDPDRTAAQLARCYRHQTIGWAVARRCALNQERAAGRRMGENDAWQAALAQLSGHTLVGHDRAFTERSGLDYIDHRAAA